jgi:hypothetical protein
MNDRHHRDIPPARFLPAIVLLVALIASLLIAFVTLPPAPPGYESIRIGMSKLDVEAFLGPSDAQSYGWQEKVRVLMSERWTDSEFMMHVAYDALTGKVTEKRLFPLNPVHAVLFRLRDKMPESQ